jgi:predicted nuclease of restriction endonuclease-like (RecB) superfamily
MCLSTGIENRTYEKTLLNQTNFDPALPEYIRNQAKLAIKDEYNFDFLELADEHSERQLEQAIFAKIEPFLLEMGGMFSFVGSQYRLEVADKEYFIDLLLFHRRLRCIVAVELKVGEFQPEHIGKMQFYLAVLDETTRIEGEIHLSAF